MSFTESEYTRSYTLSVARGEWTYELRNPVEADSDCYGPDDYLLITKNGGTMNVVSL